MPITPQGGILPFAFMIFQFGLQFYFKGSDGDFYLSIRLRMCQGRVIVLDLELGIKIHELGIIELLSIV